MAWETQTPHPDWYGPRPHHDERLTTLDGDDQPPCDEPCPHWSRCNQTGDICARWTHWMATGHTDPALSNAPESSAPKPKPTPPPGVSRRTGNGDRLRAALESWPSMSLKKHAEKLGVGYSSMWRWETGLHEPPADVVERAERIARELE